MQQIDAVIGRKVYNLKGHDMKSAMTTFALLGTLTIGAPAYADSFFSQGAYLDEGRSLELRQVTTDGPGIVEIFDYRQGVRGAMLGREALEFGANADIRILLDAPVQSDVLAVLTVNGERVAAKHFHVREN